VLQMAILAGRRLAILDETDSGLDIDAPEDSFADGGERAARTGTFFGPRDHATIKRLLDYIVPDRVHGGLGRWTDRSFGVGRKPGGMNSRAKGYAGHGRGGRAVNAPVSNPE